MFTPGGQIDRITFMGVRGGGGGKGGGGGSQPPPQGRTFVDPVDGTVFTESPYEQYFGGGINPDGTPRQSTVDRFNEYGRNRRAGEATKSTEATTKAAEDKTAAHNTWQTGVDTAYTNALNNINTTLTNAGLDPSQYQDSFVLPTLNTVKSGIQTDSPNAAASFLPTLGETILGNITNTGRNKAETAFNNTFKSDYADTLLPDTGLDTAANTILDEQFNPVGTMLKAALDRGTLNQTGYDAALAKMGQTRTGAFGTVRDLGRNILNEDRGFINDILKGGRDTIASLKPNQAFDPLTYDTQAKTRATSETGSFGGELRGKVGSSKYINIGDLINTGGAAQGAYSPSATNTLGGAPLTPEEEQKKLQRGLGNTGAF
jgi:hypothetical protein